jgi:RimJ/RimL family protein N-acetyltransferase
MENLMVFAIRVNGEFAGVVEIEDRDDSWFIGYWIGVRFRRKGLVTTCILDILKHDIPVNKPITARVSQDNIASQRVLEKIGLTQTHTDSEWAYYKKYT